MKGLSRLAWLKPVDPLGNSPTFSGLHQRITRDPLPVP